MQHAGDCFVRVSEGEWLCRAPCTIDGPEGFLRLTPGVAYRKGDQHIGLDIAALLDGWHASGQLPPTISLL